MKTIFGQAIAIVSRLNTEDKIRLVRRLERETMTTRWKSLLTNIDRCRKGRRFSMAEINDEIEKYRKSHSEVIHKPGR